MLYIRLSILLLVAAIPVRAQVAHDASLPSFEVATIKPGKHITNNSYMFSKGRFKAEDATIKGLIRMAYDLQWGTDDLLSGGPAWVNSATFDIEAKAEEPPPSEWVSSPAEQRNRLMLQGLLADRFKLRVHHEAKELRVWALVIAKDGPKLKASPPQPPPPGSAQDWKGIRGFNRGLGQIDARHETTSMFVEFLQYMPEMDQRLVIDKTGLTGEYDFTLHWSPEGAPQADLSGPALFTALQEQLGLNLESIKSLVDMIVIDSVEMPTAN